jgi:UvrD-like helicase family protein
VQQVIGSSYAGLFVDEYQDCTRAQHAIVLMLAELLACRILGDPLQGIFGFNKDPLVDLEPEVEGTFEALPPLETPHRWKDNQQLGAKLPLLNSVARWDSRPVAMEPLGLNASKIGS